MYKSGPRHSDTATPQKSKFQVPDAMYGKPSLEHDTLTIVLRAADGNYSESHARATATGTFALNNVSDGRYRLGVVGQSQDCYLKAVQYSSIDGLADGFTVLRASTRRWRLRSVLTVRCGRSK